MLVPSKLTKKGLILDAGFLFMGEKSLLFLKKIESEEKLNDRIIEQAVYGNTDSNGAYRKLKSRFRRRLIDEIYYGTFEKYNTGSRNQILALLMKQYSVSQALKLELFTQAYISSIKEIHAKAIKFDFPIISQLTVQDLFYYYAFVDPNKKLMVKYKEEKENIEKEIIIYNRVAIINGELSFIFTQEKFNPSKTNRIIIKDRIDELIKLAEKTNNFSVNLYKYDLCYYYFLVEKKYDEILLLSEEAQIYYENKQIEDRFFRWTLQSNRIFALIHLKQYDKAEKEMETTFGWLTSGTRAWFHLSDFKFICFALQSKLDKATEVIADVLQQSTIKNFNSEVVQWESRYILFSLLVNEDSVQNQLKELNYKLTPQRFLKKHSGLLKDKKAMNLTYRIVEIIYNIKTNKFNRVIDIIDNLGQFKYKYLRDNDTYRAQCFIRLLEILAKSNFHQVRVRYLAEPLLKKMKSKDAVISNENIFAEILPFEEIWHRIINLL